MAITYVGKSAFASGTGSLSVAAVSGCAANDLLIMVVHSANQTITTPSGWTEVTGSPQSTGTAGAAGGVRIGVFYFVLDGADTADPVADSGSVTCAIKFAFRGVDIVAPFNATAGSTQSATTSMSWPGLTTTVNDCMLVLCCAQDTDATSTATSGALTNAGLTSITERHDQTVTSGAGGGVVVNTGLRATAGTVASSTSTGSTSVTHAYVTLALKPYVAPVNIDAELVITDAADALTATAITVVPTIGCTLSITDAADGLVAEGSVALSGALDTTETGDTLVATAHIPVAPPTYHIDYDNGNDTNDGLSWLTALKTFIPIGNKIKPLPAGSLVKLARTQPEMVDPLFTISMPRSTATNYALTSVDMSSTSLATHMPLVVARTDTTSGWSVRSGRTVSLVSSNANRAGCAPSLSLAASTAATVDQKQLWYACPATLNLSSYPRLEMRLSVVQAAAISSTSTYLLKLCSDTAGDTPLLSIPIVNWPDESGIFGYDGTLPDGVNSIAIYHGPSIPGLRTGFFLQGCIATKLRSDANYIGLNTAIRLGEDESSMWSYIGDFSGGGSTIRFPGIRVPDMAHNATALRVYLKRTVGWAGFTYEAGDTYYYQAQARNTQYGVSRSTHIVPLFNLTDIVGDETYPVVIRGGYDPADDSQSGKSMLSSCGLGTNTVGKPLAIMGGTSYVEFHNIEAIGDGDCFVVGMQGSYAPDMSHHITFRDSGFYSQVSSTYGGGALWDMFYNGSTQHVISYVNIIRCHGSVHVGQTSIAMDYNIPYYGWVMDECVVTPVLAMTAIANGKANLGCKVLNGVKLYCAKSGTTSTSANCYTPTFEEGSTGRIEIYGTGTVGLYTGSNTGGEMVFEDIYAEGCELHLYTKYSYSWRPDGNRGTQPSAIRVNTLTYKFTSGLFGGVSNGTHAGALLKLDNSQDVACPVVVENFIIVGDNSQPASIISENFGGFECESLTVNTEKHLIPCTTSGNIGKGVPFIFRNMTLGNGALLSGAVGNYVFDSVSTKATAAYTAGGYQLRSSIVLKDSNLVNVGTGYLFTATYYTAYPTQWVNSPRGGSSLVAIDSPGHVDPALLSLHYTQKDNGLSKGVFNYTLIDGSSHKVYATGATLDKDTSVYTSGPSSWKSTLQVSNSYRHAYATPIAHVPLMAGAHVTISISLRRQGLVNNHIGLIVEPGDTVGPTPANCAPIYADHTAGANVWQTVKVSYTVAKSGMCLISLAHWGAAGGIAWYDTIKVVEA